MVYWAYGLGLSIHHAIRARKPSQWDSRVFSFRLSSQLGEAVALSSRSRSAIPSQSVLELVRALLSSRVIGDRYCRRLGILTTRPQARRTRAGLHFGTTWMTVEQLTRAILRVAVDTGYVTAWKEETAAVNWEFLWPSPRPFLRVLSTGLSRRETHGVGVLACHCHPPGE